MFVANPDRDTVTRVDVATQALRIAGDDGQRWTLRTTPTFVSLDDGLGGRHALRAGGDLDQWDWTLDGAWARTWLGVVPPRQVEVTRVGIFVQDGYRL